MAVLISIFIIYKVEYSSYDGWIFKISMEFCKWAENMITFIF